MFEVGKTYRDRKGNKVDVVARILVDVNTPKLLVVTTHENSCLQTHGTRQLDGKVYNHSGEHESDLVDPAAVTDKERELLIAIFNAVDLRTTSRRIEADANKEAAQGHWVGKVLEVLRNATLPNA